MTHSHAPLAQLPYAPGLTRIFAALLQAVTIPPRGLMPKTMAPIRGLEESQDMAIPRLLVVDDDAEMCSMMVWLAANAMALLSRACRMEARVWPQQMAAGRAWT